MGGLHGGHEVDGVIGSNPLSLRRLRRLRLDLRRLRLVLLLLLLLLSLRFSRAGRTRRHVQPQRHRRRLLCECRPHALCLHGLRLSLHHLHPILHHLRPHRRAILGGEEPPPWSPPSSPNRQAILGGEELSLGLESRRSCILRRCPRRRRRHRCCPTPPRRCLWTRRLRRCRGVPGSSRRRLRACIVISGNRLDGLCAERYFVWSHRRCRGRRASLVHLSRGGTHSLAGGLHPCRWGREGVCSCGMRFLIVIFRPLGRGSDE